MNNNPHLNPMLDLHTTSLSDDFMMFEFKVRRCNRSRPHDWTDCPFTHPGEKARRRNPKLYNYSAAPCPEFKKGSCLLGDSCELSHGVFECWLHPSRYRTQLCKDGAACLRPVCFFAHSHDQLRVVATQSCVKSVENVEFYDGSPARKRASVYARPGVGSKVYGAAPMSPDSQMALVDEIVASLRQLELRKVKSMPASRGFEYSTEVEEGVRVESGRALRAKLFEKLSREVNGVSVDAPDFGWISELVK